MSLASRIAAFEKAAQEANDPGVQALKISEFSDRKKYNFAVGLEKDLQHTRAAIRDVCAQNAQRESVEFGELYRYTAGMIANLNKILMNLKSAREVSYDVEIFFQGKDDREKIVLLDKFWEGKYTVDAENVFRNKVELKNVPEDQRKGRSYVAENLQTKNQRTCSICDTEVDESQRITIRGRVVHQRCVHCVLCGANPRVRSDFVTFDGNFACSAECIQKYDAANQRQERK